MQPISSQFSFQSPTKVVPEIESILGTSRFNPSVKGSLSPLGLEAVKIIKDTNLMRYQNSQGFDQLNSTISD